MRITINPGSGEVVIDGAYGLPAVRFDTRNVEPVVSFIADGGQFVCSLDDEGKLEVQFLPNQPGRVGTCVMPRLFRESYQAWSMSFHPVAFDP